MYICSCHMWWDPQWSILVIITGRVCSSLSSIFDSSLLSHSHPADGECSGIPYSYSPVCVWRQVSALVDVDTPHRFLVGPWVSGNFPLQLSPTLFLQSLSLSIINFGRSLSSVNISPTVSLQSICLYFPSRSLLWLTLEAVHLCTRTQSDITQPSPNVCWDADDRFWPHYRNISSLCVSDQTLRCLLYTKCYINVFLHTYYILIYMP